MKRKTNRQPIDTLYILGAGSSKALTTVNTRSGERNRRTTPIDRDFLHSLYNFSLAQGWQKRAAELLKDGWLDSSELTEHGLEEAVIKRVAHYDLLSSLYPDKSRRKCTNEEYLNALTHLITDYLMKCKSNSSGSTKKFVSHVFPIGNDPHEYRNRIVTFNYDLIVDRPLLERGVHKKKIYFDRIGSAPSDSNKLATKDVFVHPLILKMHGSLNWRCNRSYFDQVIRGDVNPTERALIWSNDTRCPSPEDNGESPLIIPPIPNKPITKASIFRFLWTTAFEYLHEAQKIVIVGYSCPETDTLAQSMFTQFRNMNVNQVTIVDPAADALPKYDRMISGRMRKSTKWQYYRGFSEYIENMEQ